MLRTVLNLDDLLPPTVQSTLSLNINQNAGIILGDDKSAHPDYIPTELWKEACDSVVIDFESPTMIVKIPLVFMFQQTI